MSKKRVFLSLLLFILIIIISTTCHAADPKIVTTIKTAFESITAWIIKIATPAAAVAVGTGVFMKKFSFGDEEKIRTGKRLIRGSLFSYAFILAINLILSAIQTLAGA
ncbi:MAG: pilin [Oscillospiraceae bacterium]|nr:pilin [Oscillospiraceae bacterium]